MFTGTADGRIVKLENGEVETIARFGSGPCSKSVIVLPDICLLLLRKVLNGCVELTLPRSQVHSWRKEPLTTWQIKPDLGITTSSAFAVWSLDFTVPDLIGSGPGTSSYLMGPTPHHSIVACVHPWGIFGEDYSHCHSAAMEVQLALLLLGDLNVIPTLASLEFQQCHSKWKYPEVTQVLGNESRRISPLKTSSPQIFY